MDWCMQIAIEGPDSFSDHDIEAVISIIWKQKRHSNYFCDLSSIVVFYYIDQYIICLTDSHEYLITANLKGGGQQSRGGGKIPPLPPPSR